MEWAEAIDILQPYVVKIATPRGSGTGFMVSRSTSTGICAVATAAHVVDNAHYWGEPIRIHHHHSEKSALLRAENRAIFLKEELDTAAVLFHTSQLEFPEKVLELSPEEQYLMPGYEIGWLGFPAFASSSLCFFSGRVSAFLEERSSYLADGVAINGVSGGPAFSVIGESLTVIGVVSAYIPNRATGETLPGLCEIRDVGQFQQLAKSFESMDQARDGQSNLEVPPPPSPENPGGEK
jgi:Trypsin-like peptidase domain